MTENNEIQNLTYEQAITELDTIINNIENNSIKLTDSISLYEKGTKLKKTSQTQTINLRNKKKFQKFPNHEMFYFTKKQH